jgi:hypothetical protein
MFVRVCWYRLHTSSYWSPNTKPETKWNLQTALHRSFVLAELHNDCTRSRYVTSDDVMCGNKRDRVCYQAGVA